MPAGDIVAAGGRVEEENTRTDAADGEIATVMHTYS